MKDEHRLDLLVLAASWLLGLPGPAGAQEPPGHPAIRNLADIKLGPVPALPTCAPGAVLSGDPATGPSVLLGRVEAGCVIPWHWHTPNEHLMMVGGVAQIEVRGEKRQTLEAGGFALMPSGHVHQLRCVEICTMYVYSDKAFDIHYVDAGKRELTPEAALRAVKETPAVAPK